MVEIIPKEKQVSPQKNTLFYVSLILLIVCVGGYFILMILSSQAQNKITTLKEELEKQRTSEMVSLEGGLISLQKKINDFSILFPKHTSVFGFFQLLENKTHPDVYFYSLILSPSEFRARLSGRSKSFDAVDQQIQMFTKEELIDTVDLINISLNQEGEVEFVLDLIFDPKFFKPYGY
ncbi:MAG TPA: hypothetical protein PLL80_01765 [Candidatus Pacearchaeota archaeon]|nr:hypothetical protein [Candidatus Pacearchaeota archaeon]HOK94382.1 hypothetical protein [Candidatus Pacearchaeota archaeon]HPO75312.1 hypothetical protein [Candidatus Pacearchaeota archaeon]